MLKQLDALVYFIERYKAEKGALVYNGEEERKAGKIEILPLVRLLIRAHI